MLNGTNGFFSFFRKKELNWKINTLKPQELYLLITY